MSIIAKAEKSEFEKLPLPDEGTVQAVCCGVWDLGMQKTNFKGEEKTRHKVVIAWELNQLINAPTSDYNGQPYMLSKTYTLSLYENAALRKDLESWRGRAFTEAELETGVDMEKLYGVNCLIGVTHQNGYANITSILPLMKGVEKIKPVRGFEEEPPKWVKEKQAQAILPAVPETSDDFPFGDPQYDEVPA